METLIDLNGAGKTDPRPGVKETLAELFTEHNAFPVYPRLWARLTGYSKWAYLNNFLGGPKTAKGTLTSDGWVFENKAGIRTPDLRAGDVPDGEMITVISRPSAHKAIDLDASQEDVDAFLDAWVKARKSKINEAK